MPAGNKLEKRPGEQTGTRLWKSLGAMSGILTLFFGQKREVIKLCFVQADCSYNNKWNELVVGETRDRKARAQQLETRGRESLNWSWGSWDIEYS